MGIAQLVQGPTEKSGAILMLVQIPHWLFSQSQSQLPVQTLVLVCTVITVSVQHLCAIACINTCAHIKIPSTATGSHTIVWTGKYCTHWQDWVALLLWLQCLIQVRWLKFPKWGHWISKYWKKQERFQFSTQFQNWAGNSGVSGTGPNLRNFHSELLNSGTEYYITLILTTNILILHDT